MAEAFNLESSTILEHINIGNHGLNSWAYQKGKYNGYVLYKYVHKYVGSYKIWKWLDWYIILSVMNFFRFLTCCQISCLVGRVSYDFVCLFMVFFFTKNASYLSCHTTWSSMCALKEIPTPSPETRSSNTF